MAVIFDQDLFIPVDVVLEGSFAPAPLPVAVAAAPSSIPAAASGGPPGRVEYLQGLLTQVQSRRRPPRAA